MTASPTGDGDLGSWGGEVGPEDIDPNDANDPTSPAGGDAEPQLYYATVEQFVREFLAPTWRRHLDGRQRTWCPEWWRHPEGIIRLEALWRAWEHLRLDPALGVSVWLRDHADPHMSVLPDPDGPFKHCGPDRGHSSRLQAHLSQRRPVLTSPSN